MKALILNNGLAGGGIEKLLNDMLPIMRNSIDCELMILSDKDDKYGASLSQKGVKVSVVPREKRGIIQILDYLKKAVLKGKYDVIHANGFPMFYYIAVVKKALGKRCPPIILTEHNTDNRRRHHKILKSLERFIYSSFSKIISISEPTQNALIDWLGIKNERMKDFSVIHNGIPLSEFESALPVERSKISSNILPSDFLICMVGSFTKKKNHIVMLPVIEQLSEKFKLICLGEGPTKKDIQNEVEKKGLGDRFVILGFRKDVASIIKSCNAVIIPSIWEGFGLIAVEAMACGTPVIASDVSGLSDVVGDAGILVDPNDSNSIVKAIVDLSENKTISELIQRGFERARLFDIRRMVQSYISVYISVIKVNEGNK